VTQASVFGKTGNGEDCGTNTDALYTLDYNLSRTRASFALEPNQGSGAT